jgi:hypothetical protein
MSRAIIGATAIMCTLAFNCQAIAQNQPDPADLVLPTPGEPQSLPSDVKSSLDGSSVDIGATVAGASAFLKEYKSNVRAIRSARDIAVYRDVSPAVVLVVTNEGFGSGSLLLENNTILTNWHVVKGYRQVNVVFNPQIR